MEFEHKIFDIIVSSMIIAQKEKFDDKKAFVMNEIKKYLSPESYDRYYPFISIMIDGVKILSRSNLLKNLKNSKCCF